MVDGQFDADVSVEICQARPDGVSIIEIYPLFEEWDQEGRHAVQPAEPTND